MEKNNYTEQERRKKKENKKTGQRRKKKEDLRRCIKSKNTRKLKWDLTEAFLDRRVMLMGHKDKYNEE